MIKAILDGIARKHAQARAAAALRRFDDRQLRDLGITRDQIDLYVTGNL